MMKIENAATYGWAPALRGMRNPMDSWDKSDSEWCLDYDCRDCCVNNCDTTCEHAYMAGYGIGKADHELAMKLSAAGTEHRKYLRMINVTCDITAPLYWWKEFDTYKVGTVRNSCSTMHTIHKKPFGLDDFSHEHLIGVPLSYHGKDDYNPYENPYTTLNYVVNVLNFYRERYMETGDKEYWWQIIQLLPSSYNQRATVQMSYEALANIYRQRRNHKLDEWRGFCKWIEKLPYSELITGGADE